MPFLLRGVIMIRPVITTNWFGARSGFIKPPATSNICERRNRSTAIFAECYALDPFLGRQALRGGDPSRPTDKIRSTERPFGAGWITGPLAIRESESNTRLVGWRGWTPGAAAMQPPAFLAFVYADTVEDVGGRYRDFARHQIDYILGATPRGAATWSDLATTPATHTIALPTDLLNTRLKTRSLIVTFFMAR